MSATSAQDKERRINLSINRLISQIVPPSNTAGDDEAQERQEWYADEVRAALREYVAAFAVYKQHNLSRG